MKQLHRILGFFCVFLSILTVHVSAAHAEIDVSTASDGYFSVVYEGDAGMKMKVAVTAAGQTTYYDYTPGVRAVYALDRGDGTYTITLYRNFSGTRYQKVLSKTLSVTLKSPLAPYLASTTEITFAADDAVGLKAAALCEGLTGNQSKIVVIHNFIAGNFRYDDLFAAAVRKGSVKNYTPNTNDTLNKQRGVCYDFSALLAAMCRSQGIPCKLMKGYTAIGYHAWNLIYIDGAWVSVDVTSAVVRQASSAKTLLDCIASPM